MHEQSWENRVDAIIKAVRNASPGDSSLAVGRSAGGDGLDRLVEGIEDLLGRSKENEKAYRSSQEAMLRLQITSEMKDEDELSREHALLIDALKENVPDTIYFKDAQSRFVRLSKAHVRAFTLIEKPEVVGKTDFDFFTDEHAHETFEDEQRIMRTGQSIIDKEEKETWPDRPATWVMTRKMPLRDQEGHIVGTCGISKDITERKLLEENLERERMLLSTLIENLPDYVSIKDRESRVLITNKANARVLGVEDAQDAVGKTDRDFYPPAEAEKYVADEQDVMGTGNAMINEEEESTDRHGHRRWTLTTKVPLRNAQGKVVGIICTGRDVTDRKHAEERIQDLARFPDEDPNPVMRVSLDGSILYENHASRALLASWAGAQGGRIPAEHMPELLHAWASGENREIEAHEGTNVYELTIAPILSRAYINLYGRDITEEKSLAERFLQAQKMEAVGRLAGGIAHDFNNLLTVIGGYCDLAAEELPEGTTVRTQINEIARATKQAAGLTTQLLAFSRKQVLVPRVIFPNGLVRAVESILARLVGEDIELKAFLQPEVGDIKADPGQIEQVLMNLVINARDAMPGGGRLTIQTSNRTVDADFILEHPGMKPGEYVRISVSDTGHGMPPDVLPHIFEPFFTTKERGKGTGLGLSTVYGIIEQSGGHITCSSEVGRGTTFAIYLPRTTEERDAASAPVEEGEAVRGNETILLVEDDEMVRRFTQTVLRNNGYTVIAASGGGDALTLMEARGGEVSLLVTDVVMPQMSVKELAQKLVRAYPDMKILFVSGYTGNAISHHGMLDPGVDFIQKPFHSREFLARVREILNRG
jgi:PAS domain S-box-containing protein